MTQEDLDTRFASLAKELKQEVRDSLAQAYHQSIKAVIEVEREYTERVVKDAIESSKCDCPLECIQRGDVRHLVGVIKDIGDGDVSRGIRVLRDNHMWTSKFKSTSNKIANTALVSGIGIVVVTFLSAVGVAIRIMIGGNNS